MTRRKTTVWLAKLYIYFSDDCLNFLHTYNDKLSEASNQTLCQPTVAVIVVALVTVVYNIVLTPQFVARVHIINYSKQHLQWW